MTLRPVLRPVLRQALRQALGGVVAGALVLLTAAPAAAHASLVSSDPEEGAVVASVPDEIVLRFNEPVRLESGGIRAFDPAGDDWEVEAVSRDNLVVVTPSGDPGTGTVVVSWKVTSEDGHEVSGALTFAIGEASPGGPDVTAPDAPASVTVARVVLAASSLLGLVGCLGLALSGRERAADLAWNVGLGATVLLGPLHSLAADGRGPGGLTDWLAWLEGLTSRSSLLLLAAYAVVAVARRASRRALVAATVPVLALVVASAVAWPVTEQPATAASSTEAGPTTSTGELGDEGSAELTVTPGAGRTVRLDLRLLTPDGTPLVPFAPPTVTVVNDDLSLGEAELAETADSAYEAEVTVPLDGEWSAEVSVRISEFDNPVVAIPFTVG